MRSRWLIDHFTFFMACLFSSAEKRPPTAYPMSPFEEQQIIQRAQRPPSQKQQLRLQVDHQPQPQQPAKFSQLLSGPGYQDDTGASSSSKSGSLSRVKPTFNFSGGLYSEGQSEIKPLYQGGSMVEPSAIETQEVVPERKKRKRSPEQNWTDTLLTDDAGRASTSIGVTASKRRKPASKVSVACHFCRGKHVGHHSRFVLENLTGGSISYRMLRF